MARAPHMRLVWQWRREILAGYSVKDIAQGSGKGYSESTIRNYTKAERAKVREREKEFKERVEYQKMMREVYEQQVKEAQGYRR